MAVGSSIAQLRRTLSALWAVPLALACAAAPRSEAPATAPAPAPAQAAPSAPDTSEVDALERDLSAAENELLDRLASGERVAIASHEDDGPGQGAGPPAPPAAEAAPPAPAKPATASGKDRDETRPAPVERKKKAEDTQNDCQLACRAMASMRRSAARICEIVSEANERCSGAHRRVDDAQRRIEQARCACSP